MVFFGKKKIQTDSKEIIQTYSPMSSKERLFYVGFLILALIFTVRYILWWFQPQHIPTNTSIFLPVISIMNYILFVLLTYVVFFGLILRLGAWFTAWFMKRPKNIKPQENLKVAFITCYVPGKEPLKMLEKTLISMRDNEYKHDTWVLDEGRDPEVQKLAKRLGINYFSRQGIAQYNLRRGLFRRKTKAGNLNSWRNEFENDYEIIAQIDMDHKPHKKFLKSLLGYFTDPQVGYVGIPQVYKNTRNWIAKGASEQTHFYYGPIQQGSYGSHMPFLIGTSHLYRVVAMQDIGGYAPTISEDYLTGFRFVNKGWKGVYVPKILARGLGPTSWADYFNQQMRWSYGLYEILFSHTRTLFSKLSIKQKINIIFSQLFYFNGFTLIFGVFLTVLYLFTGITPTNMEVEEWILYAFPAYFSNFSLSLFLHKYHIDRKNEPRVGVAGMLLGQAASIVYAYALVRIILRKRLVYTVTPKGRKKSTNIRTFTPHITILFASVLGLEWSFIQNFDSEIMRFWATMNILLFSAIIGSNYVHSLNYYKKVFRIPTSLFKSLQISRS